MNKFMPAILAILIMFGCVSGVPYQPSKPINVSHRISVIILKDVEISKELLRRIILELDRFPQSHNMINRVVLYNGLDGDVTGYYRYATKTIAIDASRGEYEIIKTLWHEIGHALTRDLDLEEWGEWYGIYKERLKQEGLNKPTRENWDNIGRPLYFPSAYSTYSIGEFIAEHIKYYMNSPKRHKIFYPKENKLILKHFLIKDRIYSRAA